MNGIAIKLENTKVLTTCISGLSYTEQTNSFRYEGVEYILCEVANDKKHVSYMKYTFQRTTKPNNFIEIIVRRENGRPVTDFKGNKISVTKELKAKLNAMYQNKYYLKVTKEKRQLTRKTKVGICKKCGRSFTIAKDSEATLCPKCRNEKPIFKRVCSICNKEFTTKYPEQKFCSKDCRRLHHNELVRAYVRKVNLKRRLENTRTISCPICGKEFTTVYKNQKYCSDKCRLHHYYLESKIK